MKRPKIGVGIIIQDSEGRILVGKRKGSHAPFYSIPGGHLELGESFETAAIKEVAEETGLTIRNPRVIGVTNNLRTYAQEGIHSVSVNLYTNEYEGRAEVKEKDKCEGWFWVNPREVPDPHFDASAFAIQCFLEKQFYIPDQD